MALTFSSARSRSVICFASVAMKEASLLEGLAEPTPGTPEISHSKRCRADVRRRRGRGCGRATRARRECHRNLLVAACEGANRAEAFRARGGLGLRGRARESGEVTRDETYSP